MDSRKLVEEYIKGIDHLYRTGEATELSYRSCLQQLLEKCTGLDIINEKKRIACGAPDLTIDSKNNSVAYIETKNIGDGDLDGRTKHKEQFERYKKALDTIVFTDYLDFHLYVNDVLIQRAELAYLQNNRIVLNENELTKFDSIIEKIKQSKLQKISSPKKLAEIMAYKAILIRDAVIKILSDNSISNPLYIQFGSFKRVLNKNLDENSFADLYAQTVAYGLFAARIHDSSDEPFTRQRAAELIPETNPFLRDIFNQLAGNSIKKSIAWIVDDLVLIFDATDVVKLRRNISRENLRHDPMIHFYEEFLSYYDPETKKKYGVYYTPQPVVEFIVRAIDDILKNEFNIPLGLSDTSKVEKLYQEIVKGQELPKLVKKSVHRVQILDPATGTGTFLAEVVSRIKDKQDAGIWPSYVKEDLLPRLYGFELMMAPYTIAHLKLDMLINWWNEQKIDLQLEDDEERRVQIYLTNSLDRTDIYNVEEFAAVIAQEANKANYIKNNAPVMVVIGNPPYNSLSQNNSDWITNLMADYKKEPGGIRPLQEKKTWLSDDYCKFIRLGQYYVEHNQDGILAYICNNRFLDGPSFRGMRWNLLKSFDKIYIINLHGCSKPKEFCPDGGKDENVFDIQVGTSINIFVKTSKKQSDQLATVYYTDVYGLRKDKYDFLSSNELKNIKFRELKYSAPFYSLRITDEDGKEEYNKGFRINDIFKNLTLGFVTANDKLNISFNPNEQIAKINELINMPEKEWRIKYRREKDSRDWKYQNAKNDALSFKGVVQKVIYRPFDTRYTYYTGNSRGLYSSPQSSILSHMLKKNIAFIIGRQGQAVGNMDWNLIFCVDSITDLNIYYRGGGTIFPLYVYPQEGELNFDTNCKPNLDESIWRTIENWVEFGQEFRPLTLKEQTGELGFDAEPDKPHFLTAEDIFDYIYGVLHSPLYREKYKTFLKIDFPRIPYPKNKENFEHYRYYGNKLRKLHLMQNFPESHVTYDIIGNDKVELVKWLPDGKNSKIGRVYINDKQYFSNVPIEAWDMYIGGYQPAQKWLKDRKDRKLTTEEKKHYKNIITILLETKHIMDSIDSPVDRQLTQLQRENAELRQKLQDKQQSAEVHYHIDTLNNYQDDHSTHLHIENPKK